MNRRYPPQSEGPYASYIDLFTGLILIFLLIVCILILQQGIARASAIKRQSAFVEGVAERLKGEGIAIEANGTELRFPESLLFASGDFTLTDNNRKLVRRIARVVRSELSGNVPGIPCNGPCKPSGIQFEGVVIEGHADGRPMRGRGAVEDNLALSVLRASAVYREFVTVIPATPRAPDGSSLPGFVSAAGYGATRPLPGTSSTKDEPRNRRIVIRYLFPESEGR